MTAFPPLFHFCCRASFFIFQASSGDDVDEQLKLSAASKPKKGLRGSATSTTGNAVHGLDGNKLEKL